MENNTPNIQTETVNQAAGNWAHDYEIANPGVHPKTAMFQSFLAGATWQAGQDRGEGWVSCEDRLPENEDFCNDEVLFCTNKGLVFSGGYDYEHGWYARGFNLKEFKDNFTTHWMPLPKPPQSKSK